MDLGIYLYYVGDYVELEGGIMVLNAIRLGRSVNKGKVEGLLG
jgi:hypothetical protein